MLPMYPRSVYNATFVTCLHAWCRNDGESVAICGRKQRAARQYGAPEPPQLTRTPTQMEGLPAPGSDTADRHARHRLMKSAGPQPRLRRRLYGTCMHQLLVSACQHAIDRQGCHLMMLYMCSDCCVRFPEVREVWSRDSAIKH